MLLILYQVNYFTITIYQFPTKLLIYYLTNPTHMFQPKNIVITGGNSGVGYETVRGLYQQGHHVIFGSRSVAKNQQAIDTITQKSGGSVISFPLDLSKRSSVQEFVQNVKAKFDHVDILVNNAGLILNGDVQRNQQGIQMTLAINHFGPFYLTYLLWGWIIKSPQARIINVSSEIHYRAPNNYLQDIQCQNKGFTSFTQYSISKLFNVLFTRGLNDLITKNNLKHVKTAVLHPGVVDTNFGGGSSLFKCFKCICCCILIDQQSGARTSLHLCRIPLGEIRSGQYYDYDTRFKDMDRRGRNIADVQKLWKMSEKAYGITFQ